MSILEATNDVTPFRSMDEGFIVTAGTCSQSMIETTGTQGLLGNHESMGSVGIQMNPLDDTNKQVFSTLALEKGADQELK